MTGKKPARLVVGHEREQIMATVLLLNLITIGDVQVQLIRKGVPGIMTQQSIEGMGLAASALRILYGITEAEVEQFTHETLGIHERKQ